MLQKKDIIHILESHKENELLKGIRIGLAGSYAKNKETQSSDLDLVFDGDSRRIEAALYAKDLFPIDVDILWLDLLKEEDMELDKLLIGWGLEPNPESIYKNVIREVVWL